MSDSSDPCQEEAPQAEMPKYQCHKKVWALKIKAIGQSPESQERINQSGDWYILPEEVGYGAVIISYDFINKHRPQIGGYYVVYDDGYKSYSPAKAFEDGYTRI